MLVSCETNKSDCPSTTLKTQPNHFLISPTFSSLLLPKSLILPLNLALDFSLLHFDVQEEFLAIALASQLYIYISWWPWKKPVAADLAVMLMLGLVRVATGDPPRMKNSGGSWSNMVLRTGILSLRSSKDDRVCISPPELPKKKKTLRACVRERVS